MSLNGAMQVGRSALVASQAAIQVAGNNMANAATPGFHRQSVHLSPLRGEIAGSGQFIGRGVQLLAVRREIDAALQSRLRDSIAGEHAALMDQRFLTAIETLQNELSDDDVSSLLSRFFNSFSEVANNPEDNAVRAVAIQEGQALAAHVARMRGEYGVVIDEIDRSLGDSVTTVDDLLDQVALLNTQIVTSEYAQGQANALRDQRDMILDELSEYTEITVIEQEAGSVDVLIGSIPVVLAGESRGIEMRVESDEDGRSVSIRVAADGTTLDVGSGRLGGLLRQRTEIVEPAIDDLNTFAGQLVFQVNRLHAQGQGQAGFESVEGTYLVGDTTATLNSADAALPFDIDNGSFFIHVTHQETGLRTTHRIDVNGATMSLDDLIAQINANVPNVTAGTGVGNPLRLDANGGYEISFSDDSSGALAALGLNTFFTGSTAADIDVNQTLLDNPDRLAAGLGHVAGSNGTATAIADLQDQSVVELTGMSLREFWQRSVNTLAVKADAANTAVESSMLVKESLAAQVQAVSGVSLDEESINLLTYQRQFQAAARFIGVIDETLQTLLTLG
ncbi:MAG: flagellar hook-associated protein FlgK [Planctomycetota bacterium]|jgi:flagellar hook-associated protein 1 FlgK